MPDYVSFVYLLLSINFYNNYIPLIDKPHSVNEQPTDTETVHPCSGSRRLMIVLKLLLFMDKISISSNHIHYA